MRVDEIAAVILYDEIASGLRAKDVCDRLTLELPVDSTFRLSLWRTDLLEDSTESQQALAEAVAAHIVVLALKSTTLLSDFVQGWLDKWAKSRHVQDAAVVVLSKGSEGVMAAITAHPLREFAATYGLQCFCESESNPSGTLSGDPDKDPHPAPLPRVPERPGRYSHWGLND